MPFHTEQSFPRVRTIFELFLLQAVMAAGTVKAQLRSFLFLVLDNSKYVSDLL